MYLPFQSHFSTSLILIFEAEVLSRTYIGVQSIGLRNEMCSVLKGLKQGLDQGPESNGVTGLRIMSIFVIRFNLLFVIESDLINRKFYILELVLYFTMKWTCQSLEVCIARGF